MSDIVGDDAEIDDECSKCDENAGCIYNEGAYKCQCDAGYEGDGYSCTGIFGLN